jgi:hypothetical protein
MAAQKAMHKDGNLLKRNALVIPGGLLALYGLLGLAYVSGLRGDTGSCGDANLVVVAGACRSATLVLAIPIVLGLAMVGVGSLAFRNKATCRRGHGSWTHFGLAFLVSLTLVPLFGALLAPSLVGEDAVITRGTVDYPVVTVLGGLAGIGLLMLIPFVILYAAQARANPCCSEKGCFDPCFCDEPAATDQPIEAAPEPPAAIPEPPLPAAPNPDVMPPAPTAEPVAPVPPVVEPLAPPPAQQWETVPEPAQEAWEVVPDGSADESSKVEAVGRGKGREALAARPADPAAPPADAMAVAAKWAEEDEQALHDDAARSALERAGARRPRGPKTPSKKPVAKAAKPKASKSKK